MASVESDCFTDVTEAPASSELNNELNKKKMLGRELKIEFDKVSFKLRFLQINVCQRLSGPSK